jgi:fatty acid amide hydrolase 2
MESSNPVHGRTNNVYDASRTVGGSSGGTAATVSALGAPFAITSDVGGSTRIPSLFNGLFGLKPTGGAVSNDGTTPTVINRTNWFCQLGPCARHAEDLLPLLKIIAGPGQYDPACKTFQTRSDLIEGWVSDKIPVETLRFLDCRRQPGSSGPLSLFQKRRDEAMIKGHDKVVEFLKLKGACITPIDFPELSIGFDIWAACMGRETKERPFRHLLAEGKPGTFSGSVIWAFKELLVWVASWGHLSDHTLPGVALAALEAVEELASGKNKRLCEKGESLRMAIAQALGKDGVMILPNLPTSAPSHEWHFLLRAAESAATGLINVLEFPSCAVPLGLDRDGLPVGIQIIANHGNDHLCVSVARALEEGGIAKWVPPVKSLVDH